MDIRKFANLIEELGINFIPEDICINCGGSRGTLKSTLDKYLTLEQTLKLMSLLHERGNSAAIEINGLYACIPRNLFFDTLVEVIEN
jgi:hypothetical protein